MPLDTKADFELLIKAFPQLEDCMYRSDNILQIAKDMANYLNVSHVKAWIEE